MKAHFTVEANANTVFLNRHLAWGTFARTEIKPTNSRQRRKRAPGAAEDLTPAEDKILTAMGQLAQPDEAGVLVFDRPLDWLFRAKGIGTSWGYQAVKLLCRRKPVWAPAGSCERGLIIERSSHRQTVYELRMPPELPFAGYWGKPLQTPGQAQLFDDGASGGPDTLLAGPTPRPERESGPPVGARAAPDAATGDPNQSRTGFAPGAPVGARAAPDALSGPPVGARAAPVGESGPPDTPSLDRPSNACFFAAFKSNAAVSAGAGRTEEREAGTVAPLAGYRPPPARDAGDVGQDATEVCRVLLLSPACGFDEGAAFALARHPHCTLAQIRIGIDKVDRAEAKARAKGITPGHPDWPNRQGYIRRCVEQKWAAPRTPEDRRRESLPEHAQEDLAVARVRRAAGRNEIAVARAALVALSHGDFRRRVERQIELEPAEPDFYRGYWREQLAAVDRGDRTARTLPDWLVLPLANGTPIAPAPDRQSQIESRQSGTGGAS